MGLWIAAAAFMLLFVWSFVRVEQYHRRCEAAGVCPPCKKPECTVAPCLERLELDNY